MQVLPPEGEVLVSNFPQYNKFVYHWPHHWLAQSYIIIIIVRGRKLSPMDSLSDHGGDQYIVSDKKQASEKWESAERLVKSTCEDSFQPCTICFWELCQRSAALLLVCEMNHF